MQTIRIFSWKYVISHPSIGIQHLTLIGMMLVLFSCKTSVDDMDTIRSEILFDDDWKFYRGIAEGAGQPGYDDSKWRSISLPHDWSIEDIPGTNSPIDSGAVGGVNTGFFVGGTGWYRKTFTLPPEYEDKHLFLRFDGVYMNADIWLNGNLLGNHPYGYTSFGYDITDRVLLNQDNIIAVEVKNEGMNTRWYSGSGIYRHAWLVVTNPVHVGHWGVYITTPEVGSSTARIHILTRIENKAAEEKEITLVTRIMGPDGIERGNSEVSSTISSGSSIEESQEIIIDHPELWKLQNPVLYRAITEVYDASGLRDRTETPFGIRTITFDVNTGFRLNGETILLKGGCVHHGNGPLGSAAFDRAEERRVELMKANGFNAIRCAHNPPSPAFLDACDRIGILVIDEAFDMWRDGKNPQDYHLYFDDWWQEDIGSMVLRDRNHPSIIMWSIGNEIYNMDKPEVAEVAKMLADRIRELDPTRPVTAAVNRVSPDMDPFFDALDVGGYNYRYELYVPDHTRIPNRIMYGSESYPLEAFEYWMAVKDHSWVIGDFVWTGFDYLGESSIGWLGYPQNRNFYPWNHAYCGDIDICGFKRPQSFYRDVLWENDHALSIFVKPPESSFPTNPEKAEWSKWEWQDVVASWNWEGYENELFEIEVYCGGDRVELFLNDESFGQKETNRTNQWIAGWEVPYQPGILRTVSFNGPDTLSITELRTAGDVVRVRLTADRDSLRADGQDLSFITVELLDSEGIRNPTADNLIQFEIEGPGEIAAVGSSKPNSVESYRQHHRRAYQGRCLVIVRTTRQPGMVTLRAASENLETGEITIHAN